MQGGEGLVMKRKWLWLALVAIMFTFLLSRLERAMLYHPTPLGSMTPAQAGIPFQSIQLSTSDGETLGGWWLPRPEPEAPRLVFFHGNAGNREHRIHNLAGLWHAGISVLIFDYRGYAESTGTPGEAGLIQDGLAAYDWVAAQGGGPVALFGRSLGGAVAAQVAARRPAAALVLESTFTSVPDMAGRMFPLPGIRWVVHTRLDTRKAVSGLTVPLLVIHGQSDDLIPFVMGQTLFNAATTPDKQFFAIPGGGHNDTYLAAGEDYFRRLSQFLKAHAGRSHHQN